MKSHLAGRVIDPPGIDANISITDLVDRVFEAYNAARLREASQLFARKMLDPEVTVGVSVSGALTPAGLGVSCLVPLMQHGFIDWVVSTGANLYHDAHFAIGAQLHRGDPKVSDVSLRHEQVVRIYDILFDFDVLLSTDAFFREVVTSPEFDKELSTAELHYRIGRYAAERERVLGTRSRSVLATAYEYGIPIYTSSPGDSGIGMNLAAARLQGSSARIDVSRDVNETAAIVYDAQQGDGKSGVLILGGGSPKNFVLQTEPQIQEVLALPGRGHDYFIQFTDARPDTGGLSGATPAEAVSWGKIGPERLPDTVVGYIDTTIALPLLTAYAMANRQARPHKRLYDRLPAMLDTLGTAYRATLAATE